VLTITTARLKPERFLFSSRLLEPPHLSTRQYLQQLHRVSVGFEPMLSTMPVLMMNVREMDVLVNQGFVPVRVGMRLDTIPRKIV
jgi:hypothetical protein